LQVFSEAVLGAYKKGNKMMSSACILHSPVRWWHSYRCPQ